MWAVDATVLLRLLLDDCDEQSARAVAFIAKLTDEGERMFVAHAVLCDVASALARNCSVPRADIARVLNDLLRTTQFEVEDPAVANRALLRYRRGGGDLADYLIAETAAGSGCRGVVTFDPELLEEDGFLAP